VWRIIIKKINIVIIRANIVNDIEATMTRFLNELNREIINVAELQHYVEFKNMVHMVTKIERLLEINVNTRQEENLSFFLA
jgi:DNA integrity scanning protein DisA with diadenylate cyclase activity